MYSNEITNVPWCDLRRVYCLRRKHIRRQEHKFSLMLTKTQRKSCKHADTDFLKSFKQRNTRQRNGWLHTNRFENVQWKLKRMKRVSQEGQCSSFYLKIKSFPLFQKKISSCSLSVICQLVPVLPVQSMPCFLVLWNPLDLGDPQWTETYEQRKIQNWNELWVWSNSKIRDRIYRLGVFMVYLFLSDLGTGDHQIRLQVALGREEPQSLDLRGSRRV